MTLSLPANIDECITFLRKGNYVGDRSLATTLFLSLKMGRPVFLEGEAGVGKTEIANVVANVLDRSLIRLQCYEGLDVSSAVYEWNYQRQMIEIRLSESRGSVAQEELEENIFSDKFLIKRPLLRSLEPDTRGPPVLLIDELDRSDEPFEAYLLELLGNFQITIPEFGTVRADEPPIVIVTSNRTREIHDALKRRCFYFWLDYPDAARERDILALKAPELSDGLSAQVVAFVHEVRKKDLFKKPGIAETIDWAKSLHTLDRLELDRESIESTIGILLKYQDDIALIKGSELGNILSSIGAERKISPSADS
tara:strand:- start:279 stop:1208 length:930 start_codon:yes stop_codon:yes gene_type:complete